MSEIDDIIANAVDGKYSEAGNAFDAAMQAKIQDKLDQHKAMIAQNMFDVDGEEVDDYTIDNIDDADDDIGSEYEDDEFDVDTDADDADLEDFVGDEDELDTE